MDATTSGRGTQRWTLFLVCIAVFMLLLDLTVVSVALASIQREFNADLADLQWVVDAYTLPLACLLLTAATLSDRIGRRRVFLAGMAIFTIGSLACALAWSPLVLDLTRALQGVGGALLLGTALPLIAAAYPDVRRRAGAIGIFGATLAAATAVGPLVGGALVEGPGWRWIFLVNVPIGAVALVLGAHRLRESRADRPRRLDLPGTALLTGALLCLVLALIRGNADGWSSLLIVGLFAGAGVLLVGFLVREATAAEPMLDLGLFRSLPFTGVAVAAFAISATVIGSTTYLALYMLNTLGYGPLDGGLRFLPLTVASFLAAPLVARLVHRVPAWLTIGGGLALGGVGMVLMGRLDAGSEWTALLAGFVFAGAGMGALSSSISQAAVSAVETGRAGMATGAVNTMRQIGVAAGVAVLGAVFQHQATQQASDRLADAGVTGERARAAADAIGGGAGIHVADGLPAPARAALAHIARAATASALDDMLVAGGIACIVSAAVAAVLIGARRRTGESEPVPQSAPRELSVSG
ncbi:MAG: MFS transporter [Streptosporangiales bacterium]